MTRSFRLFVFLVGLLALFAGVSAGAPPRSAGTKQDTSQSLPLPENAWPALTEQQQTKAVDDLKEIAGDVAKKLSHDLLLHETKYFLFYSDLKPVEAANWAGLLD